jgi:hypothetical protein
MRIYVDESGTHSSEWLVIGMLFVPDHGTLHPDLCRIKEQNGYLNRNPKRKARYRETHFAELDRCIDATVTKAWIDRFLTSRAVFRSIVVDWSIYQGKYFGDPFEPDALKKRRAYKKWAELLLQPEVDQFREATFILDKLVIAYGYDVIAELEERFTRGYQGNRPRIRDFQAVASWKDANQCLQLCDLLVGCIYQKLVPSTNLIKLEVRDYLYQQLKPYGVQRSDPSYWKQYTEAKMGDHFPRFSEWYWRPQK